MIGVGDRASRVARCGHEHRGFLIAPAQIVNHQTRHEARPDILERERRPVEQLQAITILVDGNERDLEVQRISDYRLEVGLTQVLAEQLLRDRKRSLRERLALGRLELGQRFRGM